MRRSINLLTLLLCFASTLLSQSTEQISIGERTSINSQILDEKRSLNIYLPYNYHPSDTIRYQVIYLLDGGLDEDFVHIAGIVQFLTFPWIAKLPPSILVGIENVDRKRDFTYQTSVSIDQTDFPTSGKSASFIEFLQKELKPFINDRYRTNQTSTLIGQSLGGLLATEILYNSPDLFDNFVIVSPSLWWDNQSLLKEASVLSKSEKGIYIAVGKEGEIMEGVARALYDNLKDQNGVYFKFFPEKSHGDVLHLAAYDAFEKLFSKE